MSRPSSSRSIAAWADDCSQVAHWSNSVGWDVEYQQVGRGAFRSWFCAALWGDFTFTNQWCNRELVICGCPPADMLAFVLPSGPTQLGTFEGRQLGHSEATVLVAGDARVLCPTRDFAACTASLPRARLEAAVWRYAGCDLQDVVAHSRSLALQPGQLRRLARKIRSMTSLASGPAGIAAAEFEDRLLQDLASAVCASSGEGKRYPGRGARARYVRRAQDYIEANLGWAITLDGVAQHVHVSGRTLELAFQNVLGRSPTDYIQTRRLNKVRQHLLEEDQASLTLADLALQNGLSHFGRFSHDYKTLFGELPSETRRRSMASGSPARRGLTGGAPGHAWSA